MNSSSASRRAAYPQWLVAVISVGMLWIVSLTLLGDQTPHSFGSHIGQFLSRQVDVLYVVASVFLIALPFRKAGKLNSHFIRLLIAFAIDVPLVEGIKRFYWLPRPHAHIPGQHAGFPSGHAVPAFLLAWLVSRAYPRLRPFWFTLAVLIAWSRVEVQAHYCYQAVLSAIIGCAIGALVDRIYPVPARDAEIV